MRNYLDIVACMYVCMYVYLRMICFYVSCMYVCIVYMVEFALKAKAVKYLLL